MDERRAEGGERTDWGDSGERMKGREKGDQSQGPESKIT